MKPTHLCDNVGIRRAVTEIGMSPALGQVAHNLRTYLNRVRSQFVPEARVTVVIRLPDDPGADIIMTNDEMLEVLAVIGRRKEQLG